MTMTATATLDEVQDRAPRRRRRRRSRRPGSASTRSRSSHEAPVRRRGERARRSPTASPAVLAARIDRRTHARRAADRSPRRRRIGQGRLPVRAHRPRPRSRRQYLEVSQYVGAAPVPLAAYVAMMRRLRGGAGYIDRDRLKKGFEHYRVRRGARPARPGGERRQGRVSLRPSRQRQDRHRRRHGPRRFGGDMYVPYALDIDGQIVTCSIRSTPRDAGRGSTADPRDRREPGRPPLGARSGGRSSWSAAS